MFPPVLLRFFSVGGAGGAGRGSVKLFLYFVSFRLRQSSNARRLLEVVVIVVTVVPISGDHSK